MILKKCINLWHNNISIRNKFKKVMKTNQIKTERLIFYVDKLFINKAKGLLQK